MSAGLLERAEAYSAEAWKVVREARIVEAWEAAGATVNLVGSLRTGLLIRHRDVDFHIYSDPLRITDSFAAMACIAEHPSIREVVYRNLLDAEDQCLEWHAFFERPGEPRWQIDMIHMHPQSPYAGVFERVAGRIESVLEPETRLAILGIKDAVPDGAKAMGIRVYQAVIRDGVRTYPEFVDWEARHPVEGIVLWMP